MKLLRGVDSVLPSGQDRVLLPHRLFLLYKLEQKQTKKKKKLPQLIHDKYILLRRDFPASRNCLPLHHYRKICGYFKKKKMSYLVMKFLIIIMQAVILAFSWDKSTSCQESRFACLFVLLRLSMAKSKISLGKCHVVLENIWVIFIYLLILISNIMPQYERTDSV